MDFTNLISIVGGIVVIVNLFFLIHWRKIDRYEKVLVDKLDEIERNVKKLKTTFYTKKEQDIEHFEEILSQMVSLIKILIRIIDEHVEADKGSLMIKLLNRRKEEMINGIRNMELTGHSIKKQKNALNFYYSQKNIDNKICEVIKWLIEMHDIFQENRGLANKILIKCKDN